MESELKKEKQKSSTFNGFLMMLGSSAAQTVLRLAFMVILARLLSPADFGVVAIGTMITGFAELLIQLGIGPALIQIKEVTDDHIRTGFTFSILNGIAMVILFYIINPFLAIYFKLPDLTWVLNVLVLAFPIRMISKVSYTLLQRELQFKKLAGSEVISFLLSYVAVGLPLAYMGYGYQALVWATLLEAIVYALVTFLRQPHKLSLGINKTILKELLSHGSLFTTANILNYFASQADYFVVGKVMGPASLGFYSRAYRLMNMSNTILGSVMSKVLFPSFSKMRDDKVALLRSLKRAYEIVFIVFIPASGLSFILAPEIIHILFGKKWDQVVPVFQILSLAMFLRIGYKVGGSVVRGHKLFKKQAIAQGVYFANVIIGAYIGSFWGLTGVAIGVYIALIIIFIHLSNLAIIQSDWNWGDLIKNIAHHMAIHIPILVINYFTAVYLRSKHVNEFLIISVVMLEWLACIVGVYKVKSKILLGDSEDWIKSNVFAKLGYKVQQS